MAPYNPASRHPIGMAIITAWTTDQTLKAYPKDAEDYTCSIRCKNEACHERLWLIGSWYMHRNTIIECPKCGRLHLTPDVRRKDLEGGN